MKLNRMTYRRMMLHRMAISKIAFIIIASSRITLSIMHPISITTLSRMSWLQHDQAPMEDNFYDTVPHIFRQLKWLKIAKEN
jgi:hypothetical protein